MAKPAVDGLEHRMGARLRVARVDIESDSGRELAARYQVAAIPAFVVVDPRGNVLYRRIGGRPDSDAIEQRVGAFERAGR
jgi:thioredoxin-related protein